MSFLKDFRTETKILLIMVGSVVIFVVGGILLLRSTAPTPVAQTPPPAPQPSAIANQQPASSAGGSTIDTFKEVSFEEVELHQDWALKKSFDYSTYRGVFYNEAELKQVWADMINVWDEHSGLPIKTNPNQPIMPIIDFEKYSVIWYADRGSRASFVTLNKVLERTDILEAHVALFYSDFGSSNLNLWTIPKTEKSVRFVESREYDRGP